MTGSYEPAGFLPGLTQSFVELHSCQSLKTQDFAEAMGRVTHVFDHIGAHHTPVSPPGMDTQHACACAGLHQSAAAHGVAGLATR